MRLDMRKVFAALVLAGLLATPAFSQFLSPTRDRNRPESRPAISSEQPDETLIRVPLPRARPKMFAAIPSPRPPPADPAPVAPESAFVAPEEASTKAADGGPNIVPSSPAEPVTVASPKTGDVFMPIPLLPMSSPRSESAGQTTDEVRSTVPAK